MANLMQVEVDASGLLRALTALPDRAQPPLDAAASETADAIVAEARSRVARRTGRTQTGITKEKATKGDGYIVTPFNAAHRRTLKESGNEEQPKNLPTWLEKGTQKMSPKPYFWVSVALEEQPHRRRVEQALEQAIAEVSS